jgi:hypothetical protein
MTVALLAQDPPAAEPPPLPAHETNPYQARIAQLEQQLFERDNEIVHLGAEWANCRATVDSSVLTSQATELVRRCEAAYGVPCTWDDKQRRVIRAEKPVKEPDR